MNRLMKIISALIVLTLVIISIIIIKNVYISTNINDAVLTNVVPQKYENKNGYVNYDVNNFTINNKDKQNYRRVEYIGGIDYYLNRPIFLSVNEEQYVGNRWYPFYRDKDTGEILRGLEKFNFIDAGECFVGLDHLKVPEERATKKGFQDYILKWTGAILFSNYKRESNEDFLDGVYLSDEYLFDRSIDLLVSDIWFDSKNISKEEAMKLNNVDDVLELGSVNVNMEDAIYGFNENDWILNILRNCFGFISDDFYDIAFKNINKFNEISYDDLSIGDIGVYYDEDNMICIGMCVGFNNKKQPIFTICSSPSKNKYLKDINDIIGDDNYIKDESKLYQGYNFLHIENKNIPAFVKYYKTYLPFSDENEKLDNTRNDLKINDVYIFNRQILYKNLNAIKNWNGNNLYKQFYEERRRRILDREKQADILNDNIGIFAYNNTDITSMHFISELTSNKFCEYLSKFESIRIDERLFGNRKSDREKIAEISKKNAEYYSTIFGNMNNDEFITNYYNKVDKDELKKFISKYKNEIKKCSNDDEIKEFLYSENYTDLEFRLIKIYLYEHPEALD